jgi:peptidoglycan/LPS O-acetylase OafA/YrhL
MASQAQAKVRIEGLDLLRLFAALSVVIFHYAFRGAAADSFTHVSLPALAPVAKYGYLGVDLFFVISGFVIAWSAEGRHWSRFAVARFARIYPAFVFCMSATFLVTLLIGMQPFEASLPQWLANLVVFSPALGEPFMDGAYWSIVYELVFYGWIALFLMLGLFPRYAQAILVVWLGLSILNEYALGSGALQKLLLTDHSGFFAVGVVLYMFRRGERGLLNWALLGLSVLVALDNTLLGADWLRDHYKVAFDNWVLILCGLGAIGLVAAASHIGSVPLSAGVVAAIGGLTYPLYLLHQHAGFILINRFEGILPAPLLIAATIAVMILAAWAVWRFVEPPARRLIYRLADRPLSLIARLSAPQGKADPAA